MLFSFIFLLLRPRYKFALIFYLPNHTTHLILAQLYSSCNFRNDDFWSSTGSDDPLSGEFLVIFFFYCFWTHRIFCCRFSNYRNKSVLYQQYQLLSIKWLIRWFNSTVILYFFFFYIFMFFACFLSEDFQSMIQKQCSFHLVKNI